MNWRSLITVTTLSLLVLLYSTAFAMHFSPKAELGMEDFYLPIQKHTRHFSVYTPANKSQKPMPAVFIFHGYGMDDRQMMRMTHFNAIAEKEGFLAVYPQGLKKMWNSKGVANNLTEDVDFVEGILTKLKQNRNIDSKHIYATGFSNGGLFVERLACEMPGQFAAFATVSATIGKPQSESCSLAKPAPILMIHGTRDPIVTWKGEIHRLFFKFHTSRLLSVQDTLNLWLQRNGCDVNPTIVLRKEGSQKNLSLKEQDFQTCKRDPVSQIIINGGGHTWPGNRNRNWLSPWYVGKTYRDLDASTSIWNFFSQF
jgi:polyhydroxybutyrate depolymerase